MAVETQTIAVFDPATGAQIAEVVDGGSASVDLAVKAARESYSRGLWRDKSGGERARIMWRAAELLEKRTDELAKAETINNGMPMMMGRMTIARSAEVLRYNAGWCTRIHGITADVVTEAGFGGPVRTEYQGYTRKEPVGVAGLITPWNVPISMAVAKLAPALAAGCSCVLKPAEETPLTTATIVEIFADAGVPDGVINLVNGHGHTVGAALSSHHDIDKISFTGSTEVGRLIVQAAAGNLKKVSLELGGKSPVLIFGDADLAQAIPGAAIGGFANSGQVCMAGTRIFVHRSIYDDVVAGLTRVAGSLKIGSGLDPSVNLGPLINDKQLGRVVGFIDEGRRAGAKVMTGGGKLDRPGYFVSPTILTHVNPEMQVYREEIFGPVLAVMAFDDEEEAVRLANDTQFGLAAAVWTRDLGRAHRMANKIKAGTVWLNCQLTGDLSLPFGGYKQSGWGRENSFDGVDAYLETKTVLARH